MHEAPLLQVNVNTPEYLFGNLKKKRATTQEWNSNSKNRQEYLQVIVSKQKSNRDIRKIMVDRKRCG